MLRYGPAARLLTAFGEMHMGMHIGLVCARTTVSQFREAFCRTWPRFELVDTVANLPDMDAGWAWKEGHEKFISAAEWTKENPGREVYLFWQDGPWAIMMDSSYTLASDEDGLSILSSQFGMVLSFIV